MKKRANKKRNKKYQKACYAQHFSKKNDEK